MSENNTKSVYEQLASKRGYVELEWDKLKARTRKRYLGEYDGKEVSAGILVEVRGEGTNQELKIFRTGPYRLYYRNRRVIGDDGKRTKIDVEVEKVN